MEHKLGCSLLADVCISVLYFYRLRKLGNSARTAQLRHTKIKPVTKVHYGWQTKAVRTFIYVWKQVSDSR